MWKERDRGFSILGVWLILDGATAIFGLHSPLLGTLMGFLALCAAILIFVDGPRTWGLVLLGVWLLLQGAPALGLHLAAGILIPLLALVAGALIILRR